MAKSYLNESNLGTLLRFLFGKENVKAQVRYNILIIDPLTFKQKNKVVIIDYVVINDNKTFFVEFDGYRHFQDPSVQHRDRELKIYCDNNNINYVSIPYFIQPNFRVFALVYGFNMNDEFLTQTHNFSDFSDLVMKNVRDIDWEFPHGFISKECLRPASFNIYGWNKFIAFYELLMKHDIYSIAKDIYNSLAIEGKFPRIWVPYEKLISTDPLLFMKHYPT